MSKMGLLAYKSLFCWFLMTSALFILSWFLVLRSTGRSHSVEFGILPNSKLLRISENENLDEAPLTTSASAGERVNWNKNSGKCDSNEPILKVFMYDLPSEFHFDLLGWKSVGESVWPDIRAKVPEYPGGLNLQHSIEYWLTLDLLNSEFSENLRGRSAMRVRNSSEADVVFVPFFSSISYNRYSKLKPGQKRSTNVILQEKLVQFLTAQEEWKRSSGKDHIIVAHHPNSLLDARMKLWPVMFILSDFGRYPPTIANVEKDVIAPYRHVVESYVDDSSDFNSRPTLLYFQGAIYRKDGGIIRQELYYMLKNETDVHFSFGTKFDLQVSLGTLLAYTTVAISVLILRYVPPDKVPLPSSFHEAIDSVSLRHTISHSPEDICVENTEAHAITPENSPLLGRKEATVGYPPINGGWNFLLNKGNRRKIAGWAIMVTCIGVLVLTSATSLSLNSVLRSTLCGIGVLLLLSGLILLTSIDQDDARHNFGHAGGFICPFVPLLPVMCILINVYLLVNLSAATWTLVSIWLAIALLVYIFYGQTHSPLKHAVYVPAAHVDEIYEISSNSLS